MGGDRRAEPSGGVVSGGGPVQARRPLRRGVPITAGQSDEGIPLIAHNNK